MTSCVSSCRVGWFHFKALPLRYSELAQQRPRLKRFHLSQLKLKLWLVLFAHAGLKQATFSLQPGVLGAVRRLCIPVTFVLNVPRTFVFPLHASPQRRPPLSSSSFLSFLTDTNSFRHKTLKSCGSLGEVLHKMMGKESQNKAAYRQYNLMTKPDL